MIPDGPRSAGTREERSSDPALRGIPSPAHDQQRNLPTISSEKFETTMSIMIAMAQSEKKDPSKRFKEDDILKIKGLLEQVGKPRWSERPRTYLVLWLIDEVQAMDGFVLEGLKDIHMPYTEERLPGCLISPGSRHAFLDKQLLVLSSRGADLVSRGPHRHLSEDRRCVVKLSADTAQAKMLISTSPSSGTWAKVVKVRLTLSRVICRPRSMQ